MVFQQNPWKKPISFANWLVRQWSSPTVLTNGNCPNIQILNVFTLFCTQSHCLALLAGCIWGIAVMSFLSFDPLAFLIKNRGKFITPISPWGWTLSWPGDSGHEKKNQKGHPYQTPASNPKQRWRLWTSRDFQSFVVTWLLYSPKIKHTCEVA